jgi:general L-amino acid transport system permease protein
MTAATTVAWLRKNLFRSAGDAVTTVIVGGILAYLAYRFGRFVLLTGRWEIVEANLSLFITGSWPVEELWRVTVTVVGLAATGGLVGGFTAARRREVEGDDEARGPAEVVGAPVGAVTRDPSLLLQSDEAVGDELAIDRTPAPERSTALAGHPVVARSLDVASRIWPGLLLLLVLLLLARTAGPWLLATGAVVAFVAGRLIGHHLPRRSGWVVVLLVLFVGLALLWLLLAGQELDSWGGLMLNLFLAAFSITLCFPFGVLLALGRRSEYPIISALSTAYIELFRGTPLIALLLMANVAIRFFVPDSLVPGIVVRAIVVFVLFTSAYVAEIVRGGLQSVPNGQLEAGRALGLSPLAVTSRIVLPQALRNVIPALVGQFISLFKDTTLAGAAMGLTDLLAAAQVSTKQPEFQGQRLIAETLTFFLFVFWAGSYTMSNESQRLETRLGVGER